MTASPSRSGPLLTGPGVTPGETPPVFDSAAASAYDDEFMATLFATYYFRALDWSVATTDPYLLEQASSPACTACARSIDQLTKLQRAGGHIVGGRITVQAEARISGSLVPADFVILVTTRQAPSSVVPSAGAKASTATSLAEVDNTVYLSGSGAHWRVDEIVSSPSTP